MSAMIKKKSFEKFLDPDSDQHHHQNLTIFPYTLQTFCKQTHTYYITLLSRGKKNIYIIYIIKHKLITQIKILE